jgi:hypothetical protein
MRGNRVLWLALLALVVAAVAFGAAPAVGAPDDKEPKSHGPDGLDLDRRGRKTPAATYDVDSHAPWSLSDYDGRAFTTDQTDLTTLPTVHAIYFYPANSSSRFSKFAAMFQADAKQATGLLAGLYGRGVRFDERTDTRDLTKTVLDITAFKSQYRSNKLGGGSQFSLVANELAAKGFNNPNKKYAVWLDAGSRYCGQGELYQDTRRSDQNYNERRTTAIVYRPYSTSDPLTGGFCRGRTLLHELGHNMGALQSVAPNQFDGAHCDDSAEDVMCYTSQTNNDTGNAMFDYNKDDYWDPAAADPASTTKLSWWTVNNSKYICPSAGCTSPATPNY